MKLPTRIAAGLSASLLIAGAFAIAGGLPAAATNTYTPGVRIPAAPSNPDEVVVQGQTTLSGINGTCGAGLSGYTGTVYPTINDAVTAASPGDTIYVCAGTYVESVNISEPLTLDGAQWSVPANSATARTTASNESIIVAPSGSYADVVINANSTGSWASTPTVSGFTISNGDDETSTTAPVGIEAGQSPSLTTGEGAGYVFTNNIITQTGGGIVFQSTGAGGATTTISGNRLSANNGALLDGGNSFAGSAIYVNYGPAVNTTITDNLTEYEDGNAINTSGGPPPQSSNLTISDNTSVDDVNFLFLIEATTGSVTGNTIDWDTSPQGGSCDFAWFGGIIVAGGSSGLNVLGNDITVANGVTENYPTLTAAQQDCGAIPGSYVGIQVANVWDPASTGVTVTGNTVTGAYNGIWIDADGGPMESYCSGNVDSDCGYGNNTGFTISDNTITGSTDHGLWVDNGVADVGTNSGLTLSDNNVTGSGVADLEDDTTGTGTAGTADTWTGNTGATDFPAGLLTGPGAPLAVTAIASSGTTTGTASVTFTAPASGSDPISHYTVMATDTTTAANGGQIATGTSSPITVTGLTLGDSYTFMVTATTPVGTGPASAASNAVTPSDVPGAATAINAIAGDHSAAISFGAPKSNGSAIISYKVTATDATTAANGGQTSTGSASPITVTGLTNGDSYTFTVSATNGVGTGPASAASNAVTPEGAGYWLVASDGGIFSFGDAQFYGSTGSLVLNKPIVGMIPSKDKKGYLLVASDGGVFSFGDATFHGSASGIATGPIVGLAETPDGGGYWMAGSNGEVYAFGDAKNLGPNAPTFLGSSVVGIAATADGGGYWLALANGGVVPEGDAVNYGQITTHLNKPIVSITATADGKGYWLLGADGGIFTFGDAQFYGSTGSLVLNKPVVGLTIDPDGKGYWLVAGDGGIFSFGDAQFYGSTGSLVLNKPVVGMASN